MLFKLHFLSIEKYNIFVKYTILTKLHGFKKGIYISLSRILFYLP